MRETQIREITDKIDIMRKLLVRSGVEETRITKFLVRLKKYKNIEHLSDFIEEIYSGEWYEANRIWNLPGMTEEIWNRYDLLELVDTREQKLLNKALKDLRTKFNRKVAK